MPSPTVAAPGELHYDPTNRRVRHIRACDRCGVAREVHDPKSKRNLCADCVYVLGRTAAKAWAA